MAAMNLERRWMAGLAIALVACSAPASEQRSDDGDDRSSAAVHSSPSPSPAPACDGGACIPLNGSCGISASEPTGPCCDPAARCIEYTVYDYARCRVPSAAGTYCYRNDQCASGVCDGTTATCSP